MHFPSSTRDGFESLVYDLLQSDPKARLDQRDPAQARVTFPLGNAVVLLRYEESQASAIVERARAAIKSRASEVVLLGGPPDAPALLKKAQPGFLLNAVTLVTVSDAGEVWKSRSPLARSALLRILEAGVRGPPGDEAYREAVERASQSHAQVSAEAEAFARSLKASRPVATWALAAVIGLMYLLELALGGSEQTRVLVRLGALVPDRLVAEPWRLFTSAFLHIGLMHVLLNVYVLLVIGTLLERVIGSWRFLAIFWLSVLGGSLMSAWLGSAALEAGASGGVWGLLAAESVLAFRPRGLLPQESIPRMRRAAMINLGINVVYSLRPEVAFSAHLGGGLVGALLLALPLFTAGLPKLGEPPVEGAPELARDPLWLRPLALLGVLLMGASLAAGLALGGGLELLHPPAPTARHIGATGIIAQIPGDLQAAPAKVEAADDGQRTAVTYGALARDGRIYLVTVDEFTAPLAPQQLPGQLEGIQRALGTEQEGWVFTQRPEPKLVGGREAIVSVQRRSSDGFLFERAGTVSARRFVLVETMHFQDIAGEDGSAERTLASLVVDAPAVSQPLEGTK